MSLALAAIVLLGTGMHLMLVRSEALQAAAEDAATLNGALVEHTRQTLSGLDLALIGLEAELESVGPDGMASGELPRALDERQDASINTLAYFVLDASGQLLAHSGQVPWTQDLSFLVALEHHARTPSRSLFIGPPRNDLAGPLEGQWVLLLSRRISGDDESFEGIVVAALSIDQMRSFQETLLIGANGTVGLVSEDGTVLVRTPSNAAILGQNIAGGEMFRRLADAAQGVYTAPAVTDRVPRITAYEHLDRYPIVAYIGISEADRLGAWTTLATVEILLGLLLIIAVLAASRFTYESYRQRERLAEQGRERLRTIAEAVAMTTAATSPEDLRRRIEQGAARLADGATSRVFFFDQSGDGAPPVSGLGERRSIAITGSDGRELGALEAIPAAGTRLDDDALWGLAQLGSVAGLVLERLRVEAERRQMIAIAEADRAAAEKARIEIGEVYSSMTDAVVAFDRDWFILYVNDATMALTRRSAEKLVGRSVWELFPELLNSPFETELRKASAERRRVSFEFDYPPTSLTFAVSAFPQDLGMTVYLRDITAQRQTEAQLRQSQRMEAVGQLTGGVAHDFNNLLTVIIGNIDDIAEDTDASPVIRSQARMVLKAAERAAELTQRLLAFSRRQALDPRAVDVNQLIGHLQGLVQRSIGEAVEIGFLLDSDLDRAMVDAGQLESAILNLAINAHHAMPEGGKLTIETANVWLDADYAATHTEVQPGPYVLVSVTDTGTGMDRATVERAFEPFFTTKPAGQGTGLGLSMIYGFIKQSRGHVSIYSELGHGTTVRLYLPRAADGAERGTLSEEPALAPRGNEAVLVVEDDELVRRHAEATLAGLGYRVTGVENGPRALEILQAMGPFALMLVDVVLTGGMNGRQVAEAARAIAPDMRVLYMSGYTENAIVHHGRLDPGVHLLGKPFRRAELASKVRAVIDQ